MTEENNEPPEVDLVVTHNGEVIGEHNACQVFLSEGLLLVRLRSGAEYTYVIRNITSWRTYLRVD